MWQKSKLFIHEFTWRGVLLTVEHYLDFGIAGNSRLRVSVTSPVCAITPLTLTGPFVTDIDTEELSIAQGAEAYVWGMLEAKAQRAWWIRLERRTRQPSFEC